MVSAAFTVAVWLVLVQIQPSPASAGDSCSEGCDEGDGVAAPPPPPVTGADSSAGSIGDLGKQRFNQMITHRVLGSVLLGVNEQVNCSDCVSAFGSAGSFSAGVHGRKELTPNLSLLAGIAYTQYSEGGYHITSAPIGRSARSRSATISSTGGRHAPSSTSAPSCRRPRRRAIAAAT